MVKALVGFASANLTLSLFSSQDQDFREGSECFSRSSLRFPALQPLIYKFCALVTAYKREVVGDTDPVCNWSSVGFLSITLALYIHLKFAKYSTGFSLLLINSEFLLLCKGQRKSWISSFLWRTLSRIWLFRLFCHEFSAGLKKILILKIILLVVIMGAIASCDEHVMRNRVLLVLAHTPFSDFLKFTFIFIFY